MLQMAAAAMFGIAAITAFFIKSTQPANTAAVNASLELTKTEATVASTNLQAAFSLY